MNGRAGTRARDIQRQAADPTVSVALRAAAGAGKTRTLIDRFIRLCVEDTPARCHPRSILAITFTRKAAVEIQERLLGRAARMALASEQELSADLADLFGGRSASAPSRDELHRAAGLYELLLEDLSGLKIGTIHSFCQLILNRFAAEVGLDPNYIVQENRQELVEETLDQLEVRIAGDAALATAAQQVGKNPQSVRKALLEVFRQQMRLERWTARLARAATADSPEEQAVPRASVWPLMGAELRRGLWPDRDFTEDPARDDFLPELMAALEAFATAGIDRVREILDGDLDRVLDNNLKKLRTGCRAVLDGADSVPSDQTWAEAGKLFLTQQDKIRSLTGKKDKELKARFEAAVLGEAVAVLAIIRDARFCELYAYNRNLLRLGLIALDLYDALKQRDRVVDFQDLEGLACRLMGEEARALSLLHRLDDAICHILLDEAQDTNHNQWEILAPFVAEFLSGDKDEQRRTVFLVGDVKQSIYGFRGAVSQNFRQARALLQRFEQPDLLLPTNFRSLPDLVEVVGCLFGSARLAGAWDQEERQDVRQAGNRSEDPGTVLALEPYAPADPPAADERSGGQQAADAAVAVVSHLKSEGWVTWDERTGTPQERPLRWDDFLVLCRYRTNIDVYEKAFQQAGIPYQRPGRGMLAACREVQDILALLRWLNYPDDDVALATLLRSPLLRLLEAPLQAALAGRGVTRQDAGGRFLPPTTLWRALLATQDDATIARAVALLTEWRRHVGREHVHDLLRRVYREGQVLERYELALGAQARYNLLRLLDLTLEPEVAGTPTVRTLADLVERAGRQGGREEGALPAGRDEGRVGFMTVHGAKGLEAPVVLLVDAEQAGGKTARVVPLVADNSETPLLFGVKVQYQRPWELPPGVGLPPHPLYEAAAAADRLSRCEETNLLYVAMTRARDRLVLLGGDKDADEDKRKNRMEGLLRQVRAAAETEGCRKVGLGDPDWLERPPRPAATRKAELAVDAGSQRRLRAWRPPPLASPFDVITPSAAEAPAPQRPQTGPPEDQDRAAPLELLATEQAVRRGRQVHAWLQAAADTGRLPEGDGEAWAEAAAVFADPAAAWVFRPQDTGGRGLSEVAVIHRRPAGGETPREERLTGVIDRLVLRDERIDIIDYKTNRGAGDPGRKAELVEQYRPQLTAYAEALAALAAGRPISCWLLLTDPDLTGDRLIEIIA